MTRDEAKANLCKLLNCAEPDLMNALQERHLVSDCAVQLSHVPDDDLSGVFNQLNPQKL